MRFPAILGLLALATPVWGQGLPPSAGSALDLAQVRVTSRIVMVDHEALTRAGISYVVLGNDRVRVDASRRRGPGGIEVGVHGVRAFLEAARENRWIRSESTQQVLTLSGRSAMVASTDLTVDRRSARTRGPSLEVIPTVLADGSVHLAVFTGVRDRVTFGRGYGVDGSPAAVETEIIAGDGEEVLLASSSTTRSTRGAGLLAWSAGEQGRDVLVAVTATVVRR